MDAFAHQGHGTPGLPHLARALVDIFVKGKGPQLELCLALADCAAYGDHRSLVEGAFPGYAELPEVKEVKDIVKAATPAFVAALSSDVAKLRGAAALALTMIGDDAAQGALLSWLPTESDASAAASGFLAVGFLGIMAKLPTATLQAASSSKKKQLPQAKKIATVWNANINGSAADAEAAALALLKSPLADYVAVPWCGGEQQELAVGVAVAALERVGAMDALYSVLDVVDASAVFPSLVRATFGEEAPLEPRVPSSFNEVERRLLDWLRSLPKDKQPRMWPLERVGVFVGLGTRRRCAGRRHRRRALSPVVRAGLAGRLPRRRWTTALRTITDMAVSTADDHPRGADREAGYVAGDDAAGALDRDALSPTHLRVLPLR